MDNPDAASLFYISALGFLAVFLAVLGVAGAMDIARGRKDLRARVVGTADGGERPDEPQTGLGYFKELILGLLKKVGEAQTGSSEAPTTPQGSALAQRLMSAGYRRESAPAIFSGVKVVMLVVVPVVAYVMPIAYLDQGPVLRQMIAYLLLAGLGMYGPEIWLQRVSEARKLKIVHGFPDALDLLVVCIEAGLGLDAAIFRTGAELAHAHPDLCDELHLVSLELRAGLPRPQALTNFGWRCDIPEVKSLVALLIQTDRFGTSVGQALRVHSDAMRTQRQQKAEEMAGKLPVKLLFPLIFFIFPALFIVILGPAVIQGMRILMPTLRGER